MYTNEGIMTDALFNAQSPALIVADTEIISHAPPRYMRSGIADTLAKWYESYPNLLTGNDFYLRLVTQYGAFARDILESTGLKVIHDIENNTFDYEQLREVIDCIFVIAGLCGAVRGLADTQGLAHPFYNASTAVPAMRGKLHGERVAFGLVMQAVIEGREDYETARRIRVFKALKCPLTLSELGIEQNFDGAFALIADRMQKSTPRYPGLEHPWTQDELKQAILKTDELGRIFLDGSPQAAAGNTPPLSAVPPLKAALDAIKPFKAARSLESVRREFGLTEIIKLAGNENMHGASPAALAALSRIAAEKIVPFYPDTGLARLTDALAGKLGVRQNEILFGNGLFEVLSFAALSALEAGAEAIIPDPSFGWYAISTIAVNAAPVFVPLREHRVDLDAVLRAVTPKTRLVWLCNPNNPTGAYFTGAELEAFLRRLPSSVLVTLDEAYIDFAPDDAPRSPGLIRRFPNVLSLRTFSKTYGLAGLRIGYALGNAALIEKISRVRAPVNVNALAQEAALAALGDDEFYNYVLAENTRGKELYYAELSCIGFNYIPTAGNFIMIDTRLPAGDVEHEFIKHGIMIRSGVEFGMDTWIRVTIGTEAQNKKVLQILKGIGR
jgi:histidinol-phosphate aminotransferase